MTDSQSQATSKKTSFEQVLHGLSKEGHFQAVVLANGEGLPIATAQSGAAGVGSGTEPDPELTAAMVALLQKVSKEARQELGMAELDEVTVLDRERTRLVCRFFSMGGEELILALMVRPKARYRRASTWAIRQFHESYRQ